MSEEKKSKIYKIMHSCITSRQVDKCYWWLLGLKDKGIISFEAWDNMDDSLRLIENKIYLERELPHRICMATGGLMGKFDINQRSTWNI